MTQSLILALDIGTSSVRASLYDTAARVRPRSTAKIEQSFVATTDGGAELDAELGFDNVVKAIDAVLDKTKKLKGEIKFVASCAFWHSLIGIDAAGKPTTNVIGWADTRSRQYSDILKESFDETETHNRTGARFHSSYWPAKLLWFRTERADIFAKTQKWLSFSDYVSMRLSGDLATSLSMASGTGVFDIRHRIWDAKLLKFLNVSASALPVISDVDPTFNLNKTYANRWPRLAGAQWLSPIGDGAADSIGSGCVSRNQAALMIGTSGAMRVAYAGEPPPKLPTGLWCYRIDNRRVVIGGALSDGGGLYRWLKLNLRLPKGAESQIAARPPGAHGIKFLPFLSGERSTGYNENAAGAMLGLTSGHNSVDILQAAMESVAFRFAEIFEQLNKVVMIQEIVASGGALRESPVWAQIIADVLGRDLTMNSADESSSRGAVLHTLESRGKIVDIKIISKTGDRSVTPDPNRTDEYQALRIRHTDLYKLLSR